MKKLYQSLTTKIASHKVIFIIILSILTISLIAAIPLFFLTRKQPSSPTTIKVNPTMFLEVNLSYNLNAPQIITINSVKEKPTKVHPPEAIPVIADYTLRLLNENEQILLSYPIINLPETIYHDTKLFNPSSTEKDITNITKGEMTISLPDIKGKKIQIVDKNSKILAESSLVQKITQSNFIQQAHIADDSHDYSIAFLSLGYTESEIDLFHKHVEEAKGFMLSRSPFKENSTNIVFNVVDNTKFTFNDLGCNPTCNGNKATKIVNDSGKPSNSVVVLMNHHGEDKGSHASITAFVSITPYFAPAVMHELGHLLRLGDEYVYAGHLNLNNPTTNCFNGTPPNQYWNNLIKPNSYFLGCTNSNWYRSSENSIMRDIFSPINYIFNPVSIYYASYYMGFNRNLNPETTLIPKPSITNNPSGGSSSSAICENHDGVDNLTYSNGYYAPVCLSKRPSQVDFNTGLFDNIKASTKPNPYTNGKYYDVYLCADKTYDFAPKNGVSNICNKAPWVQNSSNTLPQPPAGKTCKDPTPYWDGDKCTFRPDACNNIGPSAKVNTCQASKCGSGFSPDTNATQEEANLACANAYGSSRSVCCLENTGNNSPPKNGDTKRENPPTDTGDKNNNIDQTGQSCTNQGSSCGGSSDNACYPGWKDANNSSNQTYCCRFTERYCEAQGKCMASKSNCIAPSSGGGGNNTGGSGRENDHCYNGHSDCAPEFKCTSSTGTATSYCVYKDPSESGAYCNSGTYHCESGNTCKSGNPASPLGHNYSCQKSGKGNICCTGTTSNTASTDSEVSVMSCTRNSQCIQTKIGTACVFTNNPGVGMCR